MSDIFFIYGNQELEIKEKATEIVHSILPEDQINEYSVFQFDINDFYSKEKEKNDRLLSDLKNTCETISWLSPRIVARMINLQAIPTRNSPVAGIEKSLGDLRLVKLTPENDASWYDESSLTVAEKSHFKITANQIVSRIIPLGSNRFFLELEKNWENRLVYIEKGEGEAEAVPIKEFLSGRLTQNINFDSPPEETDIAETGAEKLVEFLKRIIPSPPKGVSLIFCANIQNTRLLRQDIYRLLEKHAKTVKTTISYDDFRPISWISDRARKKGLIINASIADLMVEICGSDLAILDKELEKLSILFSNETKLTASDLIENLSHSKKFSIFRVADFIVKKDLKNAVECMESILRDHPNDAINIFGIVAAQFRRLLKISWMIEMGVPEQMIIKNLKLNQWIGKQIIQQCGQYTCQELENIVIYLSKQDLQIKYHAKEAMMILEQICYSICLNSFGEKLPLNRHWVP